MTDIVDQTELFKRSVTADDFAEYKGNGVVNIIWPWYLASAYNYPLPAELPPYFVVTAGLQNYFTRDTTLRRAFMHEAHWNYAVAKAAAKQSTKTWKLKGNRVARWQQMILNLSGDGYIASQKRAIFDYTCTNNGVFLEIVRASSAAGSRVLGLVHLDSLRCVRTNDAETPAIFWDLKGQYHALQAHQVIMFCDMPDPSISSLGMGHCAADGVYGQIYKQYVIDRYYQEKISGTGATALDFITGLTTEQIGGVVATAKQEATGRGMVYFQGRVLAGILSQAKLEHVSIPLRELPDGFDREMEMHITQLAYANRLGIDPQTLNPKLVVSGTLGTAQAMVLHEKEQGGVLASYDAEFASRLNELVLPDSVTFYFEEIDLRQQEQEAKNALTRAQARGQQVTNGEINGAQALQMAVDDDDAPREFLATDLTSGEDLNSEEKPVTSEEQQQAQIDQAAQGLSTPTPTQPAQPPQPPPQLQAQKEADEVKALLREAIDVAKALTP